MVMMVQVAAEAAVPTTLADVLVEMVEMVL